MGNEPEKNESSQAGAWEQEKKTGRFYAWLKKAYDRLITVRGQPREVALGFALGIFIGASPTMGFQMPIAVFFAAILKWNKISAAMGVWITNPITAPFFYGFTYLVGAKILGLGNMTGVTDNIDSVSEILSKAPEIVWSLIIGGRIAAGCRKLLFLLFRCPEISERP